MDTIIKLPAIEAIQKVQPRARDQYLVCDLPGLAQAASALRHAGGGDWSGNRTNAESARMVANGDMAGVPASEQYLSNLEELVFVSKKYKIVDDVCGAVPNIPNYLAGIPQAMRRRMRSESPNAPLSIFADLTSSSGVSPKNLRKRGCAVLALVRLLSNLRPIELWTVAGLGRRGESHHVVVRIETAPLDLARAAHVLTCPSVARGLCYGLVHERLGFGKGGWAYGDPELERKHGAESLKRICNPGSDVLYIPPVHLDDKSISSPVDWIKDKLAEYGGQTVECNNS